MSTIHTEVLIIGSGAGGAVTAALARRGRAHGAPSSRKGPWVDPDATEPFSLDEMVAKYRHGGLVRGARQPGHRLRRRPVRRRQHRDQQRPLPPAPAELAEEWARDYRIDEFGAERARPVRGPRSRTSSASSRLPGAPPRVVGGARTTARRKLGWRSVEFARVFSYEPNGRGGEADDGPHLAPARDRSAARTCIADCRGARACDPTGDRVVGAVVRAARCPTAPTSRSRIRADHVFVCAGAIQTPALLQRSGIRRNIGNGLKMHPTVKIAARFPQPIDHGDVPMHRVTEFAPGLTIGGSASRRGHVALALADSAADYADALADWENVAVYYAAIRSEGRGRVLAVPGFAAPLVTYRPHRRAT